MRSDLGERLDRLAERAPDRLSADDLWERGVRRGRRQRFATGAVTVLAVVLAVALGGSVVTMLRSPGIAPAAPGSEDVFLPAKIASPGERARTATVEDRPPGRLVAVVGGMRSTFFSSETGLYGVSASTGEYVWLDLPDLDASAPVSLSPDGTRVGYWLERGAGGGEGGSEIVDGYAVLDVGTAEVFRNEVESDFGLAVGDIAWSPGRAWFQFFELTEVTDDGYSAAGQPTHLVDLDSGTVALLQLEDSPDLMGSSSAGQGFVAATGRGGQSWIPGPDKGDWVRLKDVPKVQEELVPNADGTMFAGIENARPRTCCQPGRVEVGVRNGTSFRWHTVAGGRYSQVVGWRGPSEVLVRDSRARLHAVDVETGAARLVLSLVNPGLRQQPAFATALLDAPVVPAVEIPEAVDLRWWLGGATLLGVLGAWLLIQRRERMRRGLA